ncbi:MAG: hypothetical protein ABI577_09825 [bacterium]
MFESIATGMTVQSLDDRTIGFVVGVHGCCFQFEVGQSRTWASVTFEGIFDIQSGLITLICYGAEAHRYTCTGHPVVHRQEAVASWTSLGREPQVNLFRRVPRTRLELPGERPLPVPSRRGRAQRLAARSS